MILPSLALGGFIGFLVASWFGCLIGALCVILCFMMLSTTVPVHNGDEPTRY